MALTVAIFALSRNGPDLPRPGRPGGAQVAYYTSTNTLIQLLSPGRLRGRIMSIYVFTSIGISPIGSLIAGGVAELIGAPATLAAGGVLTVAALLLVALVPRPVAARVEGIETRERRAAAEGLSPAAFALRSRIDHESAAFDAAQVSSPASRSISRLSCHVPSALRSYARMTPTGRKPTRV